MLDQHLHTEFWKKLYSLFLEKDYTQLTQIFTEYQYYGFSAEEKRDITNILIEYLRNWKVKNMNQFLHLVLNFMVSNKTLKGLTEIVSQLNQYFKENKKKARFNKTQIKLVSEAYIQMISFNLSQFWSQIKNDVQRINITNTCLSLIETLLLPENKEYRHYMRYWIQGLKSFTTKYNQKPVERPHIL